MDAQNPTIRSWAWCAAALVVVVLGQYGISLQLFGPQPWFTLQNDQPILSGRHPLHLYHGSLGVGTFRDHWSTTCYDPAFQAGYPKTPVFDDGARPAELFMLFSGQNYSPSAYKIGLFALCCIVPLVFALAAWGLGQTPSGVALSAVGGCVVWWSPPVRSLLDAGNMDHLLAGLMALVFLGSLVRYAEHPGLHSWFLMTFAVALGWFAHPLLWIGLVPVGAVYYLAVAPNHGLSWHLGLVGVAFAGLAPNLWWLTDWLQFWWIRKPSFDELAQLPHWSRVLGETHEYSEFLGPGWLGWTLLSVGVLGLAHQLRRGQTLHALILGFATVLTILVVRLGDTWPALQMISAMKVAPFAVALLVIPGAGMIGAWWDCCPMGRVALAIIAGGTFLLGWFPTTVAPKLAFLHLNHAPLHIGLNPSQREWLHALREQTTPDARILTEEVNPDISGWNWTALLPILTERAYLGGMESGGSVDHTFCGLKSHTLNDRSFTDWTAQERCDFMSRYNVGWVWCRSASSTDWWAMEPRAKIIHRSPTEGVLFQIQREPKFVLSGTGVIERADRRKIIITDAVPNEQGELLLSFHYQPGMRVSPTVIKIESDKDLFDPVPLVKLRLPGPVSRIVLSWNNP
jgi:hypothetical protein